MNGELEIIGIQPAHRIALMLLSLVLVGLVLELVRRDYLKERYALLWIATSLTGLIFGIFPQVIIWITGILNFQLLTTLYVISFLYTLGIILAFSVIISHHTERTRILAQEVALLTNRINHLEEKQHESD
jgi:heme A synthase